MTKQQRILCALSLLLTAAASHAAGPAGAVSMLSGWVIAVKPGGGVRALAAQSTIEVGDTLVSEPDSYVRLALGDGSDVVMGPSTTLQVRSASAGGTTLALAGGQLQVTGAATTLPGRFTIAAGENSIDVGAATFRVAYIAPAPGSAVALRLAYRRSSLAALDTGAMSDAGMRQPLHDVLSEVVAQGVVPPQGAPAGGGLAPGLYVHVIDGLIQLSNRGGVQQFAAGQFGFTGSVVQPPVIVPRNPGIQFTPPPAFSQSTGPTSSSSPAKSNAVDCEVR